MFALGKHAGSPYMRGTLCWIAHSAAKLYNVPRAQLAHVVPIYSSGMPRDCLCYYTLINIMAHCRPINNIVDLVITKKICKNDVIIIK